MTIDINIGVSKRTRIRTSTGTGIRSNNSSNSSTGSSRSGGSSKNSNRSSRNSKQNFSNNDTVLRQVRLEALVVVDSAILRICESLIPVPQMSLGARGVGSRKRPIRTIGACWGLSCLPLLGACPP